MHRQVASLFVAGFMVMIVAAGCRSGAPIYNVVDAPIVTSVGQERSLADVRKAIIEAGKQLNWAMVETQPGVITATQNVRSHQAVVDIKYDTKKYSITYKNSSNLKYNADGQTIHANYNSWIQNLDNAIRSRLSS
jgi:hypothetical protein